MERALKVAFVLDHYLANSLTFPSNSILKGFGHDLVRLYSRANDILQADRVQLPPEVALDRLDLEILDFLAEFARSSRYYNLDELTGSAPTANPLVRWQTILEVIYAQDIPALKRISKEVHVAG